MPVKYKGFTITEAGWQQFHITKTGQDKVLASRCALRNAKLLIDIVTKIGFDF